MRLPASVGSRKAPTFKSRRTFKVICLLWSAFGFAQAAPAATSIWTGQSKSSYWSDTSNWSALRGPAAGSDLSFPAGALRLSNTNNLSSGTTFGRLTLGGPNYNVSGNALSLTNGLTASYSSGSAFVNLPVTLQSNQTFEVTQPNVTLFLTQPLNLNRQTLTIDGAGLLIVESAISTLFSFPFHGSVVKQGVGTFWLLGNATYSTPTVVNGGTLLLDGSLSNSVVTLNSGGTLAGSGTAAAVTVNSGGTLGVSGSSPGVLTVLGNATVNAGSTFEVRLNSASSYDQLRVNGDVKLGATLHVMLGFTAAVGDRFTIIQNQGTNAVSDTFAGLPEGAVFTLNGRPFKITYGNRLLGFRLNDVVLEAVPALNVWDGGGGLNQFWSQPLNWVGDVPPMVGDDLEFTNPSGSTLMTVDDFPAGRTFGSMIFAGGNHKVQGANLAVFKGSIQVTQPGNVNLSLPISLAGGIHLADYTPDYTVMTINAPLTTTADQTFRSDGPNSQFSIPVDLNIGIHTLTFDVAGYAEVDGTLSGTGQLVKNGPGELWVSNTDAMGTNIVNAGTLISRGRCYGTVVVNPGGRLVALAFTYDKGLSDVEVHGGVFYPSFGGLIHGVLRLLDGATFAWGIADQGANGIFPSYAYMWPGTNLVQLNNCHLGVAFDPGIPINRGADYPLIDNGVVSGTFNGLPEGSRFITNNHSFTITYTNGVHLYADPPFVWRGSTPDAYWSTPTNWLGNVAPIPEADLLFPTITHKDAVINNLPPGTVLNSLEFTTNSYTVSGNSLSLATGLFNDASAGDTVISCDISGSGGAFEFRVANASTLRLAGSFSSLSGWRKTGSGLLRLEGTSPNLQHQGQILAGEVDLAKPPGVDAISGTALTVGDGTNASLLVLQANEQISGSVGVAVMSPARFDLNGYSETIGSLSGDGQVTLGTFFGPHGQLTVSQGYFTGTILGFGGLTKMGPYSLLLSGVNPFPGTTVISDGPLEIEGIETNSPIRLDGGVLLGGGSVGTISVNSGGTVHPGGYGGPAFQVALHSRDVHFNSSSTFQPTLNSISPGYESFKLQVTGTVDLGGAALSILVYAGFAPPVGSTFVIIDNDGSDPVVGTFAGLPEGAVFGSGGYPFRITYHGGDGNDVSVTRVASPSATLSSVTVLTNGSIAISGHGLENLRYSLERATNLTVPVFWAPVPYYSTADGNGLFQFNLSPGSQLPMSFYRAASP